MRREVKLHPLPPFRPQSHPSLSLRLRGLLREPFFPPIFRTTRAWLSSRWGQNRFACPSFFSPFGARRFFPPAVLLFPPGYETASPSFFLPEDLFPTVHACSTAARSASLPPSASQTLLLAKNCLPRKFFFRSFSPCPLSILRGFRFFLRTPFTCTGRSGHKVPASFSFPFFLKNRHRAFSFGATRTPQRGTFFSCPRGLLSLTTDFKEEESPSFFLLSAFANLETFLPKSETSDILPFPS